jgi:hypothetical protein
LGGVSHSLWCCLTEANTCVGAGLASGKSRAPAKSGETTFPSGEKDSSRIARKRDTPIKEQGDRKFAPHDEVVTKKKYIRGSAKPHFIVRTTTTKQQLLPHHIRTLKQVRGTAENAAHG